MGYFGLHRRRPERVSSPHQAHEGRRRVRESERGARHDQRMTGESERRRVDQNKGSF